MLCITWSIYAHGMSTSATKQALQQISAAWHAPLMQKIITLPVIFVSTEAVTLYKYEQELILEKTEITREQHCRQLPKVLSHSKKKVVLFL